MQVDDLECRRVYDIQETLQRNRLRLGPRSDLPLGISEIGRFEARRPSDPLCVDPDVDSGEQGLEQASLDRSYYRAFRGRCLILIVVLILVVGSFVPEFVSVLSCLDAEHERTSLGIELERGFLESRSQP